jgi:hypothetical protein
MSSLPYNSIAHQTPDSAILDLNGRQTYLGNAFVAGTMTATVPSTTETPYVLISNPANSGHSMIIYTKKMSIATQTTSLAIFRFYYNPTVSAAGTALAINNLRLNASSPASTMAISEYPTTSNNGTFVADLIAGAEGTNVSTVVQIIDPGNSMLVTCTETVSSVAVAFEIVWYELPYGSTP